MNETETRAELIEPMLKECGWGVVEDSHIRREYHITAGRILTNGNRGKRLIADYVLIYKGHKLAVIEAKSMKKHVSEGVAQAKEYAKIMDLSYSYSTNGNEIYEICMTSGIEERVQKFLRPEELWKKTFSKQNVWMKEFLKIPFDNKNGTWELRYYQEIAIKRAMEAIAKGEKRILLTLATGTGKTAIAFQIAWKLYQTRWNLQLDGKRKPRILFLADRNILSDQAYNSFSSFESDALVRIRPKSFREKNQVPTNGNIFFTIFQTFMIPQGKEGKSKPYFGEYPSDFFDFIIIDECHRGGANDESEWRAIMEYFNSAVQLGLTATPKNDQNTDTYKYFGYPVYTYSLKEGINDGFLTPYRIRRMQSSLDEYKFSPGDTVLQGEIDKDQTYIEKDFNRNIVIEEREIDRVKCFLEDANQEQKAIVFCSNQEHAKMIRDYINEYSSIKHPFYCVRVTADDGEEGEVKLREFQDNEKLFPTILTTSRKLSTGVDARNIRNIVLLREVKSIIEFKQIIGRGTRLFDEKEYFTIYDFVGASNHFYDPEWDGEPIEVICNQCGKDPCICKSEQPKECPICQQSPCKCPAEERQPCEKCGKLSCECIKIIKIKLSDNTMREIVHTTTTTFLNADGNRITAEEFLNNLLGELPNHFESEEELRKIWSNPETRSGLLNKLSDVGFPEHSLSYLQKLVDMEKSDLFDVLGYVFNSNFKVQTRQARVDASKKDILASLNDNQKEFISFVLSKYVESGVSQLSQRNLPDLLKLKYKTTRDAEMVLGSQEKIIQIFMKFQNNLYNRIA